MAARIPLFRIQKLGVNETYNECPKKIIPDKHNIHVLWFIIHEIYLNIKIPNK